VPFDIVSFLVIINPSHVEPVWSESMAWRSDRMVRLFGDSRIVSNK